MEYEIFYVPPRAEILPEKTLKCCILSLLHEIRVSNYDMQLGGNFS